MTPSWSYSFINELDSTKTDWKIKVRVSRLREVLNFRKNNSLICVDMVLIDEEGNYIHATIESGLWRFYRNKIVEGSIFLIENFKVKPNKENYRIVSDNKIMLSFIYETHVKLIKNDNAPIPLHKLDFMHFHKLECRRQKDYVLSDVIGILINEHGENNDIVLEIEDRSKQPLKVKLWNQCTQDYFKQKKKLEATGCKLFIIVVTSTRVKGPNAANLRVETSLSSKVYVNLEIPEVNELRTICSDREDKITVGKFKLQKRGILDHDDLHANQRDISSILNCCKTPYHQKDFICYCVADVEKVRSDLPWHYPSCPFCNKKLQARLTDFYCTYCEKELVNPKLLYRLELSVKDTTGSTVFVLFNDEAKRIIGQDASTLYDAHTNEDGTNDNINDKVPRLLRNTFENKQFAFKLKVTEFNHNAKYKQTFTTTNIYDFSSHEAEPTTCSTAMGKRPLTISDKAVDEARTISMETRPIVISERSEDEIRANAIAKRQRLISEHEDAIHTDKARAIGMGKRPLLYQEESDESDDDD